MTLAIVRKDLLAEMPSPSFLHKVGVWSPPTILNWSVISKNSTSTLGPFHLIETDFESSSMFGCRTFSTSLFQNHFFAIQCLLRKGMLNLIVWLDSLYNTLPIFSVWIAGEVMRALIGVHGYSKVAGQEAVSNAKAETLYRVLDANSDVYQPVNHKNVRSRMNICFRVKDAATEKEFLEGAEARMLQGLKGKKESI